jgi:hypothetical protein
MFGRNLNRSPQDSRGLIIDRKLEFIKEGRAFPMEKAEFAGVVPPNRSRDGGRTLTKKSELRVLYI